MESFDQFELTDDHLKLLPYLSWEFYTDAYFGAPAVNIKRPYGNSDVFADIAKILDKSNKLCPHCGEVIDADYSAYCQKIHSEMHIVLAIVLSVKKFESGKYIQKKYGKWAKKE